MKSFSRALLAENLRGGLPPGVDSAQIARMTTTALHAVELVSVICEIAVEAGREVMRGFRGRRECEIKADGSPVTECDAAAEALIEARLTERFPGVQIVAEEAISNGHVPSTLGSRFFLVDPLDGTREFVAGLPDFTVNIALVEEGKPIAGVIFAPAFGELFHGSRDGAFKQTLRPDGGWNEAHPIHVRLPPEQVIAVVSRSHYNGDADGFLSGREIEALVPVGSSLKFCRIAEGVADLYPKLGRTMEWDTAAGQAVLEAAGGSVRLPDGSRLGYGKRGAAGTADFANPHFVARGCDRPSDAAS